MKKAFLRSVAALMVACMFVLTFGGFTSEGVVVTNDGFTEIIIYGVDCSEKEQQIIAALNGEVLISPMNILCFFGHNMSTIYAVVTEHRFFTTSPRCRQTRHRVSTCTRNNCQYILTTFIRQDRITCC